MRTALEQVVHMLPTVQLPVLAAGNHVRAPHACVRGRRSA